MSDASETGVARDTSTLDDPVTGAQTDDSTVGAGTATARTTAQTADRTTERTTEPPERTPSPAGSRIAFLATALAVVVAGAGFGVLLPAVGVVLGGAALWPALRLLRDPDGLVATVADAVDTSEAAVERAEHEGVADQSDRATTVDRPEHRSALARGLAAVVVGLTFGTSVALLAGSPAYVLAFVGGVGASATVTLGAVAVGAVALNATVGVGPTGSGGANGVLAGPTGDDGVLAGPTGDDGVLAKATTPALGAVVAVTTAVTVFAGGGAVVVTGGQFLLDSGPLSPLATALVLQLVAVGVGVTVPLLDSAFEDLLGGERYERPAALDWLSRAPSEVPRWYWLALFLQVTAVANGVALPTTALTTGLAGVVVGQLLPLGALALGTLAATVVAGWVVKSFTVAAVGEDGPLAVRTLATLVPVAAVVWTLVLAVPSAEPLIAPVATPVGVAVALGAVRATGDGIWAVSRLGVLPERAGGFAVAAGATVAVGLVAAFAGGPAAAVYVAVAAALVTWYAGELGTGLGHHLGREADTTTGEVAHAVAVSLVVGAATLVVSLVTYVGGPPAWLPDGASAATAVAGLAVAALAVVARVTVGRSLEES
ncbi:hypothetical protein RYH80_17600 [Halobaculum sp. MBLA0147]|uniref:hypothetical protein n=1 Tax=Halobaculum sp. MBLA0147 TaxID=3079934 RepID=UPI003524C248